MNYSTTFISATKEFATFDQMVPAPYFRKTFELDEIPENASITICGLGFYELFLNGRKITKGFFAPYISNPDDLLYYDQYDIQPFLIKGGNCIGILLGNGMQNSIGGQVWDFQLARWRSAPKVALTAEFEYKDHRKFQLNADESFKTAPSPIYFDDLRAGEYYDARNEIEGWNLYDFDDSTWSNAIYSETPRGEAVTCSAEPVKAIRELKPVSITKAGIRYYVKLHETLEEKEIPEDENIKEGYLYDFGVNAAGLCRLKIKGKPGQKVVLQFGEALDENGDLDLRAMNFLPARFNHRDIYICKGTGEEAYLPSFTYHGFRYCLVYGIKEEQAGKDLLAYVVMNSDLKMIGGFECSDSMANKLQSAVLVSDMANFYYFPTDCPQREKNGWTADASLSSEQVMLNLSAEKSYAEWLRNIRKAQREDGALPGIVPTAGWGFHWGNGPAWDNVLVNLPYYVWLYRGDKKIIEDNAEAILRYLNYLTKKRDERGLLEFGLGDWAHSGRPVTSPKAPLVLTDTAISMDICKKASIMFDAIGMKAQKNFADEIYQSVRSAARIYLIDKSTMTALGNCQTSQAMAIYYDMFEDAEKYTAFQVLLDMIHNYKDRFDAGILGLRVLFHVLSSFGRTDLAYHLITSGEFPSFAYWINHGATSLYEEFQLPDKMPSSKNHHFTGDISSWFIQNLAGIHINPHANDVNELLIAPRFIDALTSAKAYHIAPAGRIESSWVRNGNHIVLTLKVPQKCYGSIQLEKGCEFADGTTVKKAEAKDYEIVLV